MQDMHQFEIRLVKLETVIAEREAAQEARAEAFDHRLEKLEVTLNKLFMLCVGQLLTILVAGAFFAKVVVK